MVSSIVTCVDGKELEILPFALDDIPQLRAIECITQSSPWSEQHFIRCIESGKHCYGVYSDPAELLAYIVLSEIAGDAEILTLSVHPNWQRCGIAMQLLHFGLELVRERVETVFLEVRKSNLPAITLYQQAEFNEVGVRRNYYPAANNQREDALIFAKVLSAV